MDDWCKKSASAFRPIKTQMSSAWYKMMTGEKWDCRKNDEIDLKRIACVKDCMREARIDVR